MTPQEVPKRGKVVGITLVYANIVVVLFALVNLCSIDTTSSAFDASSPPACMHCGCFCIALSY